MAKSKILKELANNQVSIEVALSRLLIIATDIGNIELFEWANNELNGYENFNELPEYRKINAPLIRYTGINGSFKVTNQPMPLTWFTQKTRDSLNPVGIFECIATIESILNEKEIQPRVRDLTFLAGEIHDRMSVSCFKISQVIDGSYYREILNKIRGKLLNIFIELDRAFGNLDDLDVDSSDEGKVAQINQKIIALIDKSIKIGDGNQIEKSKIIGNGDE